MMCFFFKQKTAYEMRISDWSSDVCSSDLAQLRTRTLRRIDLVAIKDLGALQQGTLSLARLGRRDQTMDEIGVRSHLSPGSARHKAQEEQNKQALDQGPCHARIVRGRASGSAQCLATWSSRLVAPLRPA